MESHGFKTAGLLLLILGQSVAVGPSRRCPVPKYPVNIKVLMDSWNYSSTSDWISDIFVSCNSNKHYSYWQLSASQWWSANGACRDSSVSLCSGSHSSPWLYFYSKYIGKDLPAPDVYPVKIFVNITYSFMSCPSGRCYDVQLEISHDHLMPSKYGIMPDNIIQNTSNGTKQFYFISETSVTQFSLAIFSQETCMTVSRVLVYRYECPGHDWLTMTGLEHRPATQAPVNDSVLVSAEISGTILQNALKCTSQGIWVSKINCECDLERTKDNITCEGSKFVSADVGYLSATALSSPIPSPATDRNRNTVMDNRVATEDSGCEPQTALLAVVAVLVVVIFALVLVVVALIIALVGTNRKLKLKERNLANSPDRDMSNPVYDPVGSPAAPNVTSSPSGATTGNGTTDQEQDDDDETLHNFSNNLYSST